MRGLASRLAHPTLSPSRRPLFPGGRGGRENTEEGQPAARTALRDLRPSASAGKKRARERRGLLRRRTVPRGVLERGFRLVPRRARCQISQHDGTDPPPGCHRAQSAGRRFRAAARGGRLDRGGGGGLAASRRDGRAFRAHPQFRAAGAAGVAAAYGAAVRRASDDHAGRSVHRSVRRGRGGPHLDPSRIRAASAPDAATDPFAREKGRCGAQSGHADRKCCVAARSGRHRAGDVGQPRIRRAAIPSLAITQDRGAAPDDR